MLHGNSLLRDLMWACKQLLTGLTLWHTGFPTLLQAHIRLDQMHCNECAGCC